MSDRNARGVARLAGVSEDVQLRARALADQLRSGARTLGDVQLLAYVGDQVASLVLGEAAPHLATDDDAVLWMRGFLAWGPDVLARGVVAWLWSALEGDRNPWGDGRSRGPFLSAIERWWSGLDSVEQVEASWAPDLGTHGVHLLLAVRAHAASKTSDVLLEIEHSLRGEPRVLPAPSLVAARIIAWVERTSPSLQPIEGAGALSIRAIGAITSAERRRLVAYLRPFEGGGEPVRVRLDGTLRELTVEAVEFECSNGFIGGSPLLRIAMERLGVP